MDVDCPLHLRQRSPRLWINPLLASSQGVTIHRVMGLRAPSLAAAGPEHHDYNYNDSERSIGCYDKLKTRRTLAWLSHALPYAAVTALCRAGFVEIVIIVAIAVGALPLVRSNDR